MSSSLARVYGTKNPLTVLLKRTFHLLFYRVATLGLGGQADSGHERANVALLYAVRARRKRQVRTCDAYRCARLIAAVLVSMVARSLHGVCARERRGGAGGPKVPSSGHCSSLVEQKKEKKCIEVCDGTITIFIIKNAPRSLPMLPNGACILLRNWLLHSN